MYSVEETVDTACDRDMWSTLLKYQNNMGFTHQMIETDQ
jgi:hypothetical protein